jgi:HAD superfamily hydrolase (TIGR01490 family)
MAWMMRGVKTDEAPAIWDAIADGVTGALRPAVVARLRDHQAQGHRPVLVSGSFRPIAEAVAARLDIRDVLATALEVRDGCYTGHIVPPLCQGPGKRIHVEAFLAGLGAGIDLAASYAYADSFVDEDLLSLVGHPVAVAPDAGLAAIAAERGWPVIAG